MELGLLSSKRQRYFCLVLSVPAMGQFLIIPNSIFGHQVTFVPMKTAFCYFWVIGATLNLPRICSFRTLSSFVTPATYLSIFTSLVCTFCSRLFFAVHYSVPYKSAGEPQFYRLSFLSYRNAWIM